jgi:hypothetical protein
MKEPEDTTTTIIDVGDTHISIKAKPDDHDNNPSGWSIIAFSPSASIRCVRAHQEKHLNRFILGILAMSGSSFEDEQSKLFEKVRDGIHTVTKGSFELT